MTDPTPTFGAQAWASFKKSLTWVGTHLLGPLGVLLLVVGAVVLVSFGAKDLQVGGLIAKLLGKKSPETKTIDVTNTVPTDRVDPTGKIIPAGTPDSKGDTQAVVVPIVSPNIFSNPTTVTFTPPGTDTAITVTLPDGVKNKDVSQVIMIKPDVVAVAVKDTSGIPTTTVDDLLKKYG